MGSAEFLDLVRLGPAQRQRLLATLDQRAAGAVKRHRRKSTRHPTRGEMTPMVVIQPGGGVGAFLVMMRNLSAGGLAVVHGGYLHPGTECRVLLARVEGPKVVLAGTVRRCRHVQGSLHEVGLEFDSAIVPEDFVPADMLSANVEELVSSPDEEAEAPDAQPEDSGASPELADSTGAAEGVEDHAPDRQAA